MATHICVVGKEEIHPFRQNTGHVSTAEGDWICTKHWKELGFGGMIDATKFGGKITNEQVAEIIEKGLNGKDFMLGKGQSSSISADAKFEPDFKVGAYLSADTKSKIVRITTKMMAFKPNLPFAYDDLLSYKVVEDGDSVQQKHGVGRAVGGTILFGPVGGIVGALTGKSKTKKFVTDLHIDVALKNHEKSSYSISIISGKTKPGMILDASRKSATEIAAFFDQILGAKDNRSSITDSKDDPVALLREYKSLLDDEVITQDEFDEKKKELLGM